MGLSISQKIVADHGGTIRADSEPGRGASFTLKFPVAPRLLNASLDPDVHAQVAD
ncbi:MAG TPA: ATP-binding protein [Blastocatellia bacterium]|nr:ATP-binding protein [Blastocatellia bacterium]